MWYFFSDARYFGQNVKAVLFNSKFCQKIKSSFWSHPGIRYQPAKLVDDVILISKIENGNGMEWQNWTSKHFFFKIAPKIIKLNGTESKGHHLTFLCNAVHQKKTHLFLFLLLFFLSISLFKIWFDLLFRPNWINISAYE